MVLQEEDLTYIKEHLGEWLAECSLGKPPAVYEIELRERMVRVEEELKHHRILRRGHYCRPEALAKPIVESGDCVPVARA